MADLKEAAEQFAKDLVNQNIAGLMMAFTPNGMGQAMALQAQMQGAGGPQPTGTPTVTVELQGQEGDDHLVDIVMSSDAGTRTIATRWKDVAGAWKVDGIALKA
ncbi:MAG: hypothetical protein K6U88_01855 [Dehalococcoidia bacterium]|nr:hypothetical protein [Dehalococcoidia bacterium]